MVGTMKDQSSAVKTGRRHHERQFKNDLIAQSLVPGASISAIAMQAGVNANLLFKWRRLHVQNSVPAPAPTLLPVCVIPDRAPASTAHMTRPGACDPSAADDAAAHGVIEIDLAGAQLRLRGTVDEAMLHSVLRALRQTA
jgi:transposase